MHIINDSRLRADDLALLTYVFSKPPDWIPFRTDLQRRFRWGREKLQAVLRRLREFGYVRLEKPHGQGGALVGSALHFFETPSLHREPENPSLGTESRKTRPSGKPTVGKPVRLITTDQELTTDLAITTDAAPLFASQPTGDPILDQRLEKLLRGLRATAMEGNGKR